MENIGKVCENSVPTTVQRAAIKIQAAFRKYMIDGLKPPRLIRQIGEHKWEFAENNMNNTSPSDRKAIVVATWFRLLNTSSPFGAPNGTSPCMYFVLLPWKDRAGEWARATGYQPGPDTLKYQHQWLTMKEWKEVSLCLSSGGL